MSEFVYCLNTSTIRPTPLLEKIAIAGKAGYAAIEPWNDEITAYLEQGGDLADLKRALADAGLKVVSVIALHGWITSDGAEYARVLDECRRRMAQAVELGSPYIVASPPQEVVDLNRSIDRFAELLEIGHAARGHPVDGISGFCRWSQVCRPRLGDRLGNRPRSGHCRGGRLSHDSGRRFGRRPAHAHGRSSRLLPYQRCSCLSQTLLTQKDADRVMVGEGIADLPRVIRNLRMIGYRGPLSLELFNPGLWAQDPLEVATRGIRAIQALVEA